MCALLYIAVVTFLTVASLPQTYTSPVYNYATGDALNVQINPQSFFGISDLVTLSQASSPFDLSSVHLTKPSSPITNFRMSAIQTTEDLNSAYSLSAAAQGSFGGFSGSASVKYLQSKTLTSTSSLYLMFYEKQLGTVHLNSDAKLTDRAKNLLVNDPNTFAAAYGRYFVYGATVGCQATSTVTITSKSEYYKIQVDAAAEASYKDMFSASVNFTYDMTSQKGFKHLTTEVFSYGGDVEVVVSSPEEVRTKVIDPLDAGGKCNIDNAIVSEANVRGWLTLQAVTELIPKNPDIIKALTPPAIILPHILERLNNLIMKTRAYLKTADKCHHNVSPA